MNRVIKKNFKCKLCKNKYQITDDMLRTIEIIELCDHHIIIAHLVALYVGRYTHLTQMDLESIDGHQFSWSSE